MSYIKFVSLGVLAPLALMAGMGLQVHAATVVLGFSITITEGTSPPAGTSAVGTVFAGELTYDDDGITPGSSFVRNNSENALTLSFPFFDRTITETDPFVDNGEVSASFAANGSLLGLVFGYDEPFKLFMVNAEFPDFSDNPLAFAYEYTVGIFDEDSGETEQLGVASGVATLNFVPDTDPAPIPLPAGGLLLLSGLLGIGLLRRRASA